MDEKETINQPGIIPGVEKSLFTPEAFDEEEDGGQEEENGGQGGQQEEEENAGAQPAQPTGEQPAQPAQPNGVQVVEPEKMPAQPAQPGQQPVYYAGKFKTEEDLKNAFINLGGNPNRYPTTEKLEEAYEVRQMEFTRTRQEIANQERIRSGIDNRQNPPQNPAGNPLDPEALLDKVEWDKVENGRDLGRELIKLMSQIAPKNEPNLPSETELVERIMPIMREREERVTELRDIESDIPRLRVVPGQENPFRDAFAKHVMAEKQTGSFISLRSSMKNFLSWGKSIAEEADRQAGVQKENKIGAAPLSDRGAGLPSGGQADEVDSIIGSYKARKGRLGEL